VTRSATAIGRRRGDPQWMLRSPCHSNADASRLEPQALRLHPAATDLDKKLTILLVRRIGNAAASGDLVQHAQRRGLIVRQHLPIVMDRVGPPGLNIEVPLARVSDASGETVPHRRVRGGTIRRRLSQVKDLDCWRRRSADLRTAGRRPWRGGYRGGLEGPGVLVRGSGLASRGAEGVEGCAVLRLVGVRGAQGEADSSHADRVTTAPILRSFKRIVWAVARANWVPARPMRRSECIST
jgi:hypothetical protein